MNLFLCLFILAAVHGHTHVDGSLDESLPKQLVLFNENYNLVGDVSQLWRFQVGPPDGRGETPGVDYVCLRSYHDTYVSIRNDNNPVNEPRFCGERERFRIIKAKKGYSQFYIRSLFHSRYLLCDDGTKDLLTTWWPESRTTFALFLNDKQDKLYFYNIKKSAMVIAWKDRTMDCWSHRAGDWEIFFGWKNGPTNAWEPYDEWIEVARFDNSGTSAKGMIGYSKTVGVQKSQSTTMGASVSVEVSIGISLKKIFEIGSSTRLAYDWSSTSSNTWSEATTVTASIEVPPHKKMVMYQTVGHYGVYTVYSNYFKSVEYT